MPQADNHHNWFQGTEYSTCKTKTQQAVADHGEILRAELKVHVKRKEREEWISQVIAQILAAIYQSAANEKAMKTSIDAIERRIQAMEDFIRQERQTPTPTTALTDETNTLENRMKNLGIRVDELETIPPRLCDTCSERFRSTKKTHTKCKKCYALKRVKDCKNCKAEFTPFRSKFVLCPKCHADKKELAVRS